MYICTCRLSQCFCILSAVDCFSSSSLFSTVCVCVCVCVCVQCSPFSVLKCAACFLLHWPVSYQPSLCVCVCVCVVCVCTGRYCRSPCSCRISCKEHEPPGNAQKHQHWWHQHKSAKFTLLQIVAVRSRSCDVTQCLPWCNLFTKIWNY